MEIREQPVYLGFDEISSTTSDELRQRFRDDIKSTFISSMIGYGVVGLIVVPIVATVFCLATSSWSQFGTTCIILAFIAIFICLIAACNEKMKRECKLDILLQKFGDSYDELSKIINKFCSKELYRDSKITFGQNGTILRQPPQDCMLQYETLDLYKDIILVFERDIYTDEEISGSALHAGLPVGQNIGWAASRVNLTSSNKILVGHGIFYWNRWGEQRSLIYEKHHKDSAHTVFTLFKKHCKNARFGDFDGFEEYIKEHKEAL